MLTIPTNEKHTLSNNSCAQLVSDCQGAIHTPPYSTNGKHTHAHQLIKTQQYKPRFQTNKNSEHTHSNSHTRAGGGQKMVVLVKRPSLCVLRSELPFIKALSLNRTFLCGLHALRHSFNRCMKDNTEWQRCRKYAHMIC